MEIQDVSRTYSTTIPLGGRDVAYIDHMYEEIESQSYAGQFKVPDQVVAEKTEGKTEEKPSRRPGCLFCVCVSFFVLAAIVAGLVGYFVTQVYQGTCIQKIPAFFRVETYMSSWNN